MLHVVLVEPEIPPNTGNVARLCAVTGARLHLVGPLGYRLDDSTLKRAGMDYWKQVTWSYHESLDDALAARAPHERVWCVETGGPRGYHEVAFADGDWLVFGRESRGLAPEVVAALAEGHISIPMPNRESRSLNLSNTVAIVVYEALRQMGFQAGIGRAPDFGIERG
jgi:tRNA (cytidine/uridine-2'-O-)-methyltransferase